MVAEGPLAVGTHTHTYVTRLRLIARCVCIELLTPRAALEALPAGRYSPAEEVRLRPRIVVLAFVRRSNRPHHQVSSCHHLASAKSRLVTEKQSGRARP